MNRDSTWCRYDPASRRISLALHVQPNARKNEIVGLHGGALKVKIAAPAANNKANAALIAFLSEMLGVQKSAIAIRHGTTGRRKVVEVAGGSALATRLESLAANRFTTHESRLTPTAASER